MVAPREQRSPFVCLDEVEYFLNAFIDTKNRFLNFEVLLILIEEHVAFGARLAFTGIPAVNSIQHHHNVLRKVKRTLGYDNPAARPPLQL